MKTKLDEVGIWSEIKLEIIRAYASEYSKIMSKQPKIRRHIYIDAFAGAGIVLSRESGNYVPGSPLNALLVQPPFTEFHFIDADKNRVEQLTSLVEGQSNVFTHSGGCNIILPKDVFPRARFEDYARALCLIDPYNIDLGWSVVYQAGQMGSIEIFLNFMVMDMNMNVLRKNPEKANSAQVERMNRFWGVNSWRELMYDSSGNLFGEDEKVYRGNEVLAEGYRRRLLDVAGFKYVPKPLPMRNTRGATVYYLFFASPNKTGNKIVEYIFEKYRNQGKN
ncbi:MAG TPA: three-Cys-motif partner protein TcmP [Terriglobia bacterium]|nr:three-Cys-motif partner protein TcmP [Terriglobia bacterium]